MVQEVKLSCDVNGFEPPVCRDSVLDDDRHVERPRRRSPKRRKEAGRRRSPDRGGRDAGCRHLAGADWLSSYAPRPLFRQTAAPGSATAAGR